MSTRIFRWIAGLAIVAALRRLLTMAISGTLAESELIPMRQAVVEVDIGGAGSAWAAIESWSLMVEPTRGTVPTSEEKTLDGLNHPGYGTQGNAAVKVTLFSTNDATAPLENLYDALNTAVDIRWSKGGLSGENRFYTDGGRLTQCDPPPFDANANMSAKFTFTITGPDIERELIPT
jgi:hypothetical protein